MSDEEVHSPTADTGAEKSEAAKRGRGRPPKKGGEGVAAKSKAIKKPAGEKTRTSARNTNAPAAKAADSESSEEGEAAPAAVPKKAPAKPAAKAAAPAASSTGAKKGRGRPAKK